MNPRIFAAASALFFLSGAAGLAYQIIWFKRFTHIWGSSTLAMSAVVASFLAGLGLGAHYFGRRAERTASPLRLYGFCEAAVGVLALLVPYEASLLLEVASKLYPALAGKPALHAAVEFALTFAAIGPPTFFMGATLPLFVRQFPGRTGWLYGINTIGAAVGCYLTGFHLLPAFGLSATNDAMACLNLAVALAAIGLAKKLATEPAPPPVEGPPPEKLFFIVAGLTGAASLILEMVWARELAVMLGSSTYAFTATLFVVLAGIGIGSTLLYRLMKEAADVVLLLMVGAIAGQAVLLELTYMTGLCGALRASHAFNAVFCVGVGAVVQFIPALAMGALFPLIVDRTRRGAADVGAVYAWNTVGTIVGASTTALWIVPAFGSVGAVKLALGIYGLVLFMLVPVKPLTRLVPRLALLAVVLGAGFAGVRPADPMALNAGMHHYGYRPVEELRHHWKMLYLKEGASCNVMVVEEGEYRGLYINGKVDASSRGDMETQLGLAYFPRFLHPSAKNVLVIGFGSGTTAGASLLFPGTHVTCCEIEPGVYEASENFKEINHTPGASPNFTLVLEDGRRHVQGSRDTYDLIISEPSNPWIAGVGNLFTKEFYEAAQRRLNAGGIFAQWIQTYNMAPGDYAIIVRTMLSVFPHAVLVLKLEENGDTILMASDRPLTADRATVEAAQALVDASSEVRPDLSRHFGTTDVGAMFLSHLMLNEEGLARFVVEENQKLGPGTCLKENIDAKKAFRLLIEEGGVTLNTDVNLRLEFDAPKRLFAWDTGIQADLVRRLTDASAPWWLEGAATSWGGGSERLKALREVAKSLMERKILAYAPALIREGLAMDRTDPFFLCADLLTRSRVTRADIEPVLPGIITKSESEALKLGTTLSKAGQPELGAYVLEQVVVSYPNSATAWSKLSACYRRLGDHAKEEEARQKAYDLDPFIETVEE